MVGTINFDWRGCLRTPIFIYDSNIFRIFCQLIFYNSVVNSAWCAGGSRYYQGVYIRVRLDHSAKVGIHEPALDAQAEASTGNETQLRQQGSASW